MSERGEKIARGIKAFLENPLTNLVKGLALVVIGLSDASHTFSQDLTHGHLRVGHGLIIIGLFSILGALPHLIEGLDTALQALEHRKVRKPADSKTGNARESKYEFTNLLRNISPGTRHT
jgi:hypothetical protein